MEGFEWSCQSIFTVPFGPCEFMLASGGERMRRTSLGQGQTKTNLGNGDTGVFAG